MKNLCIIYQYTFYIVLSYRCLPTKRANLTTRKLQSHYMHRFINDSLALQAWGFPQILPNSPFKMCMRMMMGAGGRAPLTARLGKAIYLWGWGFSPGSLLKLGGVTSAHLSQRQGSRTVLSSSLLVENTKYRNEQTEDSQVS